MEIDEFIKNSPVDTGSGIVFGLGDGRGFGYGSGSGQGYGRGYGYGYCTGSGCRDGSGSGSVLGITDSEADDSTMVSTGSFFFSFSSTRLETRMPARIPIPIPISKAVMISPADLYRDVFLLLFLLFMYAPQPFRCFYAFGFLHQFFQYTSIPCRTQEKEIYPHRGKSLFHML